MDVHCKFEKRTILEAAEKWSHWRTDLRIWASGRRRETQTEMGKETRARGNNSGHGGGLTSSSGGRASC